MNEELDSQLSAMFDDELPAEECELLARRLSRDEALKARWGHYALIGAVIRAERGVVLQSTVAGRVTAALSQEPQLASGSVRRRPLESPWVRMVSGAAVAAGVAALSILWLRAHAGGPGVQPASLATVASVTSPTAAPRTAHTPDSYVVPPQSLQPMTPMPPTQLADYVVAHSAYSWPISGGSLLSSLMVSETRTLSRPVHTARHATVAHRHATHAPH